MVPKISDKFLLEANMWKVWRGQIIVLYYWKN